MWRPPERIRYETPDGPWPTREESGRSRLFSPVDIGPIRLGSRTWVPAMVPWRASDEGEVTDAVVEWYERFAAGEPGAIVIEATGIRDVPSGPLLRIGNDRYLPGLERLVRAVRKASGGRTRLLIQLIDFLAIRRRPDPEKYLSRFLTITDDHREALAPLGLSEDAAIRAHLAGLEPAELKAVLSEREFEAYAVGYRERVTDTHLPHIRDLPLVLPNLFASAAKRAEAAGFDGIELHYAHAYIMASFLSARNTRSDGYGGSRGERLRLPLEVYRAVRSSVGGRIAVGCRYLTEDCIDGGNGPNDAMAFGVAFAEAGMDFLSLSRGGKFEDAKQPRVGEAAYPYTGPSGYECMPSYISDARGPYGRNFDPTHAVRAAVRTAGHTTPIVVAGGIHGFYQAEALLTEERADVIGVARQALADPDWFKKLRLGRGGEVRVCRYSNYCEALDQKHKQVTCELWDRDALDEPGITLSRDGRRRLVPPAWQE